MKSSHRPGVALFKTRSIVRNGVPARIIWTRFCNSGYLLQGISLTGFEG